MKYVLCLLFILIASRGYAQTKTDIDDEQVITALSIARLYNLSREQAILMLAILDHEKTPKRLMKTFGYYGIRKSMCPIIKYCKSDEMLFLVCSGLCAETIKVRCPKVDKEGVHKLGKRYAFDTQWSAKVWKKMKKYKNILY